MTEESPIVYVVDDDPSVRRSLARLIRSAGFRVETFAQAQDFLDQKEGTDPSCLVLDVNLPERSGLDLQRELSSRGYSMPIVFITGYGNIPMTVQAMKGGAVEFLEKPIDHQVLMNAIHQAIKKDRQMKQQFNEVNEIRQRLASLTPREKEVLPLVVSGMLNKQIAFKLGTTEKTIKVHRARIMEKMRADSLADLVRLAQKGGIDFQKS
ncbi:MAG: DNA-binding response regulator [Deltaproteobacteria bacterium RBG_13_47_9]|nr:MAG: DNA-binding response regulator [Deltaproteobacteria bacterium RBG_13_47_9]